MTRPLIATAALALCLCATVAAAPRLRFTPAEWKFAMIVQGTVIGLDLAVENLDSTPVTVTLIPTCSCNSVDPPVRPLAAGTNAVFHLRYDSTDDRGITTKSFLVRTDPPSPPLYFFIRGTVRERRADASSAGSPPAGAWTRTSRGSGSAPPAVPIEVAYYYAPGCRSCEEFLAVEIPRLQQSIGRPIHVTKKDLLSRAVYEELAVEASARGQSVTAVPALIVGDTLLQGDALIRGKLAGVIQAMSPVSAASPSAGAPSAAAAIPPPPLAPTSLAVLPVAAAGLIDGINPCAFTTLIFLLASLALAGRGRREVLVIGALFSLAVFLSYFLIGLGFFTALRALSAIALVSILLRWVLVAVLVVFAGLSVYDYTLIRAGRASAMVLQLPSSLKKRIHASIRTRVRIAALAGSSLVLGFLVSIFEFACTGQVYLPLLGYLARMQRQPDALGLLALYNLCFIVPLLVVFGASWVGVTSGRITTLFQSHMGKVKLALAVVFLGLAVFTLVA